MDYLNCAISDQIRLHSSNNFKIEVVERSRQNEGKLNPSLYISEPDYGYVLHIAVVCVRRIHLC